MTIADKIIRAKTDYDEVYEAGKKAEYDRFWDVFQSKGTRIRYNYTFAHGMWNDETFRPKYDIKPISAQCTFAYNNNEGSGSTSKNCISDLTKCFERAGVVLDTSNASNMQQIFYLGKGFTHLPPISFENCTELNATFYGCTNLETIDKLILKSDGSNTFSIDSWAQPFGQCINLKNITIEGVIGDNINFFASPLNKKSILNVIDALSDLAIGKTATFKKTAKEAAFTPEEWNALTATKPNWKIVLA